MNKQINTYRERDREREEEGRSAIEKRRERWRDIERERVAWMLQVHHAILAFLLFCRLEVESSEVGV